MPFTESENVPPNTNVQKRSKTGSDISKSSSDPYSSVLFSNN